MAKKQAPKTRTTDGAAIRFEFDELYFGYKIAYGNEAPKTPSFRDWLRREARKLAAQQPEYVWG